MDIKDAQVQTEAKVMVISDLEEEKQPPFTSGKIYLILIANVAILVIN